MIGVWFRRDLRVADHPALSRAVAQARASGTGVRAVFVATPETWARHDRSPAWRRLVAARVQVLHGLLARAGVVLDHVVVPTFAEVPEVLESWCRTHQVDALWAHHEYEVDEVARDEAVARRLSIPFTRLHDRVLVVPGQVHTQQGDMFRVYTPFRRRWLQALQKNWQGVLPVPQAGPPLAETALPWPDWAPAEDAPVWPAEEDAIHARLERFVAQSLFNYAEQRDRPDLDGTSQVSPWLAIGALSPRQCVAALLEACPDALVNPASPGFSWLNELGWRDFYQHLIVAFPQLVRGQPFQAWTHAVAWRDAPRELDAWQAGRTGFPIVDAGMRQLAATGWMHNRVRMIVASFLTKDLLIHWQAGERHFMRHLVDGDFAANNGGWQWAASTGTDAQPYFRVFNPITQGQRYDPAGDYVRRWVPELARVPGKHVHTPHTWAQARGVQLDYPRPIVDHGAARLRALQAFEAAKSGRTPEPRQLEGI
ncbi:deoxyribodipyrimidine photo-lyase [Hahella sp. SMD15-11]|uniref:Deoxyribodipyrimidine photo-lyase n=1 Tax=Thermohahella caldifontis TaxID=3142973 RepID=A0AB39UT50_9GAMM